MNIWLYPYNAASESAKALAQALGIKRIQRENSRFVGNQDKTVINWGCSEVSEQVAKCEIINKPEAVAIASNKLSFFKKVFATVRMPSYFTNPEDAKEFIAGEPGNSLVARTKLNGHSGEGIVLISNLKEFVEAPLYTVYVPKKSEYRVHVANRKAVDIQRKARRTDIPDDDVNWKIRNLAGGFVFARNEDLGNVPADVIRQATRAVVACGLDFGAVDVIYNERFGSAYVLEVNTAPGLSGQTLDNYVNNIKDIIENPRRDFDMTTLTEQVKAVLKQGISLKNNGDYWTDHYEWLQDRGHDEAAEHLLNV